ncbi:LOW QUALITY PROTEIN: adhesion G-protein coupled receptor G7 [Passerculus sandwichensis]
MKGAEKFIDSELSDPKKKARSCCYFKASLMKAMEEFSFTGNISQPNAAIQSAPLKLSSSVILFLAQRNKTILSFDFLHQELMPDVTAFLQIMILSTFSPCNPHPWYDTSELQLCARACVLLGLHCKPCRCNHTTNFAVLMAFQIKYKYEKLLDCISYIGVGLSMAGLVIIILFQILTRKTQNLSVKWMLVSLCFSMLIFNIIFISGIENQTFRKCSNDTTRCYQQYLPYDATSNLTSDRMETPTDSWCRVVAALLHCFLLAAFLWSALSSALLYLLLLRATKPLPGCFLVTMSLIKWGIPAIVVAITPATDREGKALNYQQEELNKKDSLMKNMISTISIVVVLGITWMIGYLMLISNEKTSLAFSFQFCVSNATQV